MTTHLISSHLMSTQSKTKSEFSLNSDFLFFCLFFIKMNNLDQISQELKSILHDKKKSNIMDHLIASVPLLMKVLSKVDLLKGKEKREFLIQQVVDYVNEEEDPEDSAVLFFISNVIEPLVDVLLEHANIKQVAEEQIKKCTAQCSLF